MTYAGAGQAQSLHQPRQQGARAGARTQTEVPLLSQPFIQVYVLVKRAEAMIGYDQHGGLALVDRGAQPAHKFVGLLVAAQHSLPVKVVAGLVGRVGLVHPMPEKVRDLVGEAQDHHAKVPVHLPQQTYGGVGHLLGVLKDFL